MKEPFLLIDAKKDRTYIDAQGSIPYVLTTLAKAINKLYFFLRSRDKNMAEFFKETLIDLFKDDRSPLWNENKGEGIDIIYEIKK